jgi:hypothetical protein
MLAFAPRDLKVSVVTPVTLLSTDRLIVISEPSARRGKAGKDYAFRDGRNPYGDHRKSDWR